MSIVLLLPFTQILAAENASGDYFQGTYNDFDVAVVPGPGFYFRNDVIYYNGKLNLAVFSGKVHNDAAMTMYLDIMKPAYFTNWMPFGGRYGFGANIPFLHAKLNSTTTIGSIDIRQTKQVSGLSDIALLPVMLDWDLANHQLFILFYENIYTPTGQYKKTRPLNQGHGYYDFDTNIALTWLSANAMRELSFTLGYMINTENHKIDYRTGHEMHLDFLLGQHLTKNFETALTGYVYRQLTGDSGRGAVLGSFKGFGWGLGPALSYTIDINKTHAIDVIAKYIRDINTRNRFKGNEVDIAASANL